MPTECVQEVPQNAVTPDAESAARALRIFAAVAMVVVALDQLTKAMIRGAIMLGDGREIVPGVLSFSHVLNTGAAWSMLSGQRWHLVGITVVVMGVVLQMAREFAPQSVAARVGLGLILGGAVGNLIDRIIAGAVTDFIDLGTSIELIRTFPVFNVADSALTVGVILMLADIVWHKRLHTE